MSVIADLRSGAKATIDGTGLFAQTYSAYPGSIGAIPAAFVGEVRVDLLHTNGVRQWSGEVDVVLVTGGFDNIEAQDDADTIVSAVIDAFSDAPHMAGANTVSEPVRARTTTVDNGNGMAYQAVVITVGRFVYAEGR